MTEIADVPAVLRSNRPKGLLLMRLGLSLAIRTYRVRQLERALLDAAVTFECLETVDGIAQAKKLRGIVNG